MAPPSGLCPDVAGFVFYKLGWWRCECVLFFAVGGWVGGACVLGVGGGVGVPGAQGVLLVSQGEGKEDAWGGSR